VCSRFVSKTLFRNDPLHNHSASTNSWEIARHALFRVANAAVDVWPPKGGLSTSTASGRTCLAIQFANTRFNSRGQMIFYTGKRK
jgi:hypothetical protein